MIMREEKKIEKRDEIFGAFIRSLGRSCSVSGQTMPGAVKNLAIHKFGPLTSAVQNLSKRLAMHISPTDSWGHFSAETSSNMIKRFSGMYTQCVLSGSKPEETSLFISNNLFKILAIRKKRISISSSFVGVLYGVMIALAFTMWITVGITEYMSEVVGNLAGDTSSIATGGFLNNIFNASYNIELLTNMVVGVTLIHALCSSIMLPLVKGGHLATAGIHFVVMVWVGAAAGYVVQLMTKSLFV
jgi:flagellar protein FlaJ